MKTVRRRTLAQTIIARVMRVAYDPKDAAEIVRLRDEEKMSFVDIARKLGVDPEDVHALYTNSKRTQKPIDKSHPNYQRGRGDEPVPQEGPQHYEQSESFAAYTKSIELTKMIAVEHTAEGILTSLRQALKKGVEPATILEHLESEIQDLVNTAKSKMQSLKSEAAQEQKQKAASVKKTAARGTLEDLENAVWEWMTTSGDKLHDIGTLAGTVSHNVTTLKDKIRAQAYKKDAFKGISTMAHVFDSSNSASAKGASVKTAVLIGAAERKVLHAFTDQEPMDSKKLSSDGKRLDGHWMGGNDIAHWEGDQIVFNDLGSKAAQNVQNAIRKMVPAKWIAASFDATKAAKLLAAAKALK